MQYRRNTIHQNQNNGHFCIFQIYYVYLVLLVYSTFLVTVWLSVGYIQPVYIVFCGATIEVTGVPFVLSPINSEGLDRANSDSNTTSVGSRLLKHVGYEYTYTMLAQESKGSRRVRVHVNPMDLNQAERRREGTTTTVNESGKTRPNAPSLSRARSKARQSISEAIVEEYNTQETREDGPEDDVQFYFGRCVKIILYHAFYPLSLPLIYSCEGPRYLGSVR